MLLIIHNYATLNMLYFRHGSEAPARTISSPAYCFQTRFASIKVIMMLSVFLQFLQTASKHLTLFFFPCLFSLCLLEPNSHTQKTMSFKSLTLLLFTLMISTFSHASACGTYGRGAGRSPCSGCSGCSGCTWGGCSGCSGCSGCGSCRGWEDKNGALCYPKCRSGYRPVGCCLCEPKPGVCGNTEKKNPFKWLSKVQEFFRRW